MLLIALQEKQKSKKKLRLQTKIFSKIIHKRNDFDWKYYK